MSNDDELTVEDRELQEMYARFALTMYCAQSVEADLKGALLMAKIGSAEIDSQDSFDKFWSTNFSAMMSQLIARLLPHLPDGDGLVEDLELARKVRNQFVHHFFWDHAADTLTSAGRSRMMKECDAAIDLFRSVANRVYSLSRGSAAAAGLDIRDFAADTATADAHTREEGLGTKNCGRCLVPMEAVGTERRPYWRCPECGAPALS